MDRKEITDLLRDLVRIQSVNPPGREVLLAEYLVKWAQQQEFEVVTEEVSPGRPNVYVTLKGKEDKPRLLFNTHMDVVPEGAGWTYDPYAAEIVGDELYGRGSADTKGSLAAMLMAAKALRASRLPLRGTLTIQAVMDEEDKGTGTRSSLAKGLKADFAIVGEPTSLQVAVAAKGSSTFVIRTSGKAAHSSVPHEGSNAVYKMNKIIGGLEELSIQLKSKTHPILGHPTISVDVIEGGTSPWIVPESCKIILDRRVLPGETQEEVQGELDDMLRKLRTDDPDMICELSAYQTALPAEIPSHERIAKIALEETSKAGGITAKPAGLSGTTDARFLINDARIPTIILGPGSLSQAHKADEHVSLTEVYHASNIYARIAMKTLQ